MDTWIERHPGLVVAIGGGLSFIAAILWPETCGFGALGPLFILAGMIIEASFQENKKPPS